MKEHGEGFRRDGHDDGAGGIGGKIQSALSGRPAEKRVRATAREYSRVCLRLC